MVAGAIAGNISAEATTPTGNTFAEAMRGAESARPRNFRTCGCTIYVVRWAAGLSSMESPFTWSVPF